MSEPRSLKDAYEQLKAAEEEKAGSKAAHLSARERRARTVARRSRALRWAALAPAFSSSAAFSCS